MCHALKVRLQFCHINSGDVRAIQFDQALLAQFIDDAVRRAARDARKRRQIVRCQAHAEARLGLIVLGDVEQQAHEFLFRLRTSG